MGTLPSTCGVSETGSIRGLAPPAYSESSKSGALPRAAWIIQADTPHGLRFFRQQSSRQVVWPGSCGPCRPLTLAGQVESRLPCDPRFRAPPSGRFQPHGERRRDRAMAVNHPRQLLAANAEPPGRGRYGSGAAVPGRLPTYAAVSYRMARMRRVATERRILGYGYFCLSDAHGFLPGGDGFRAGRRGRPRRPGGTSCASRARP